MAKAKPMMRFIPVSDLNALWSHYKSGVVPGVETTGDNLGEYLGHPPRPGAVPLTIDHIRDLPLEYQTHVANVALRCLDKGTIDAIREGRQGK